MPEQEEANNLETPDDIGQGEQAGEEVSEELEQPEEQAQEEAEGKGVPDDPKLLRQKMTQATQRAADAEKLLDHYKKELERLTGQAQPQTQEKAVPKISTFNDQQKQIYASVKPYIEAFLEESGITGKLENFENSTQSLSKREVERDQKVMLDTFLTKHPEAKEPATDKALAKIIMDRLQGGYRIGLDDAWLIYKSETAEKEAKQKILKENKLKAEATLPKPGVAGSSQAIKPKGHISPRTAVEQTLKDMGMDI